MKTELLFKSLFSRALKDWPEEIIFGKLTKYDTPDGNTEYSIEGLPNFPEKIEQQYIDDPLETIMKRLHLSIYDVLGYSARDYLRVKIQDLRPETIQRDFEDALNQGLEKTERWNWMPDDVKLVKDYFEANYPLTEKNNQ